MRSILLLLALLVVFLTRRLTYSTVVANDLANYVCRGTAPTVLTAPIRLSVHTADPGATGANEVTGGSYARQAAGYNTASGGACALAAAVNFAGMPAGTFTHVGIWDTNATTPKYLQGAALAVAKTLGAGDTLSLTSATNTFTG